MSLVRFRPEAPRIWKSAFHIQYADLAHLVERHLAKVEVAGSSPVIRSIFLPVCIYLQMGYFFMYNYPGDKMNVKTLRLKTDNGEETFKSFELIADHGVKGDKKAKGGDRQLCLSDERCLLNYREENIGLCVNRFMPNITTSGLDYSSLKEGDKFKINEVEIEISSTLKKCFPECEHVKNGRVCQIKRACAFAKIIKGGFVSAGDEIIEI